MSLDCKETQRRPSSQQPPTSAKFLTLNPLSRTKINPRTPHKLCQLLSNVMRLLPSLSTVQNSSMQPFWTSKTMKLKTCFKCHLTFWPSGETLLTKIRHLKSSKTLLGKKTTQWRSTRSLKKVNLLSEMTFPKSLTTIPKKNNCK